MPSIHRSVMMREVLQQLRLKEGLIVVDGTVGGGGHSLEIAKKLGTSGTLIGLDRDTQMIEYATEKLNSHFAITQLIHSSYAKLRVVLDQLQIELVDRIVLDLGLSSDQLADNTRGFSFHSEGPLDLRFDTTSGIPTWQWLDLVPQAELSSLLKEYSDERYAPQIAAEIVLQRKSSPVRTALELTELIERVLQINKKKSLSASHPATRTFQALRIVGNEELEQLHRFFENEVMQCLKPGGRLVILTFHSIEDRIIKEQFRQADLWTDITKKPIPPTPAEIRINPRSRSAKLRAASRPV